MRVGARRDRVSDNAGLVIGVAKSIGDESTDGAGILARVQEIDRDPAWPGGRNALDRGPTPVWGGPAMKANVRPAALLAMRQGELVDIGRKVANVVQGGRGAMRDHSFCCSPFPYRSDRAELEPSSPEIQTGSAEPRTRYTP